MIMPTKATVKAAPKAKKPIRKKNPLPKKRPAEKKCAQGRPTAYRKEYDDLVFKLCVMGATDKELAEAFDVSDRTIDGWKKKHAGFSGKTARNC